MTQEKKLSLATRILRYTTLTQFILVNYFLFSRIEQWIKQMSWSKLIDNQLEQKRWISEKLNFVAFFSVVAACVDIPVIIKWNFWLLMMYNKNNMYIEASETEMQTRNVKWMAVMTMQRMNAFNANKRIG